MTLEPQEEPPALALEFGRTVNAVHQLVHADPWIRGLPSLVQVHAHADAIWLVDNHGPEHQRYPEFRITEARWWEPPKWGTAQRLAARLIEGLRAELSQRRS